MNLSVQCACGRTMRPTGNDGDPRFRCGCRAAVTVLGYTPPPATICGATHEGRRCGRPKKPNEPTCDACAFLITCNVLRSPAHRERLARTEAFSAMEARRDERMAELQRQIDDKRDDIERRKRTTECDVVYYVITKPGIVKIGTSRNLGSRIAQLRLSRTDVLAAEPGTRQLEALRHKQFATMRAHEGTRREDFRLEPPLQAHIDMLVEYYGKPFDLVSDLLTRQAAELA